MSRRKNIVASIRRLDPDDAAEQIITAHRNESVWLDAFLDCVERRRGGQSFARTLKTWGLSQADAARVFDVSRQAVGKWLRGGVPTERAEAFSDLAAATDLLVHYLKRERIPAVVRRPIRRLGGVSLMDLLAQGDTQALLATCRDMFRFERAHA